MYPIRAGSASLDIHKGLYSILSTDPVIQTTGGAIYDGVTPTQVAPTYPHIVVGDLTEVPQNRLTTVARSLSITLHIYDNKDGSLRVKTLMDRIAYLFEEKPFPCQRWVLNKVTIALIEFLNDQDLLRHGVMRLEIIAQPIP